MRIYWIWRKNTGKKILSINKKIQQMTIERYFALIIILSLLFFSVLTRQTTVKHGKMCNETMKIKQHALHRQTSRHYWKCCSVPTSKSTNTENEWTRKVNGDMTWHSPPICFVDDKCRKSCKASQPFMYFFCTFIFIIEIWSD